MDSDLTQTAGYYKLWAWFETNKKQVAWGGLGIVALGLVVWYVIYQQGEKEVNASEALVNASLSQAIAGRAGPENPDEFLKIAADYPKSSAAARAVLRGASILFVEGKYPQAQAQFQRFARDYRESPFMGQAMLGIAACLDAEGKTAEAIAAYKSLIDHHPGENVVPQARFALARLYEAQNQPELALPLFEDVVRGDQYGSLGSEAGMRLEELKLKTPSLFPPPPSAMTPAPAPAINSPTVTLTTNAKPPRATSTNAVPFDLQKR
jgi:predicted negative regulator of RcsB-dependent stress response